MNPSLPAAVNPAADPAERWDKIITPRNDLFDLRLRDLWQYRDLIALLVRRDFISIYKQTILGPLWFLIQPFLNTVVFVIVFGKIVNVPTDSIPPFLFFMSGIVIWSYFAQCVTKTADTFNQNGHMFRKIYFPRLVVPVAAILTNLISFGVQFLLFLLIYAIHYFQGAPLAPSWRILLLPLLLLQIAALGLGSGCLVAAVTTRFRDLGIAVGFFIQLWMYASCVIFPLSTLSAEHRWILSLNPMVSIIESFRLAFLGQGTVEPLNLLLSIAVSLILLLAGLLAFHHVEKSCTDTI